MGSMLNFDTSVLTSNTLPQLKKAKSTLNDCKSAIASISIPSDFPEGGKIKGASAKISSIISMLSSAESGIGQSISAMNMAQSMNNAIVNNLFNPMLNTLGVKNKNTSKNEETSIFGIKIYQPGEESVDRNLVRKPKWNRNRNG